MRFSRESLADFVLLALVVQIPFEGFGHLRNRAVAACAHEWILSIDTDEQCTPEVRDEILALLAGKPESENVDAHGIQAFYTGLVARACGISLAIVASPEGVVIDATPGAQAPANGEGDAAAA